VLFVCATSLKTRSSQGGQIALTCIGTTVLDGEEFFSLVLDGPPEEALKTSAVAVFSAVHGVPEASSR
jgi:hypothetical protein